MNKIFLPTLINIHIKNFSFYPNGLDYKYTFVKGVNLIIGGNGLGKTTFVNLIKYGLIGLYKKDYGFLRTYKDKTIETRRQLPADYFSSRMPPSEINEQATLILTFKINDTLFEVTRNLYEISLQKVKVKDVDRVYHLPGKVLQQNKYERLKEQDKKECLQFAYETLVAKKANLYNFDDFIFFVNEILVFGENHKTILWDEDDEFIQERLSSKYFNDPELDNQREHALRKAKYHDSLSRHKSEDIRVINSVISKIQFKDKSDNDVKELIQKIDNIKSQIERQHKEIEAIHSEREKIIQNQKIINADRNKLSRETDETENKIQSLNKMIYEEIWYKINPKYNIYLQNIKFNQLCPMCNQTIDSEKVRKLLEDGNYCFSCGQQIAPDEMLNKYSSQITTLQKERNRLLQKKQAIEAELVRSENQLEKLDTEYKENSDALFNLNNEKRNFEHAINSEKNEKSFELRAMMQQITKLETEKKQNQEKSRKEREKAEEITNKIEEYNSKITSKLSTIFTDFAEKFLKVNAYLTYDDYSDGKGKRFIPVIDKKPRPESQSLSESQRFFIDHSYRMSLLHFFYQQPTFFICETPDSSLDISYEKNAASVFLNFLSQPNVLILTSNLNNSEFLDHIIDRAPNINYVNLLEIGRSSPIQSASVELQKILSKIKRKIDAKQKR